MKAVFADTFFFLALLRIDDPAHSRAIHFLQTNRIIVTTEFIVLELGNACARSADHSDFLTLLAAIRSSSRTRIIPLNSNLFARGLRLMSLRPDKRLVSYGLYIICYHGRGRNKRSLNGRSALRTGRICCVVQIIAAAVRRLPPWKSICRPPTRPGERARAGLRI